MQPAGLAAFAKRRENRSGIYAYEQREAKLPEPCAGMLRKRRKAAVYFDSLMPGVRKKLAWWVVSAKLEATRLARLEKLIAAAQRRELPAQSQARSSFPRNGNPFSAVMPAKAGILCLSTSRWTAFASVTIRMDSRWRGNDVAGGWGATAATSAAPAPASRTRPRIPAGLRRTARTRARPKCGVPSPICATATRGTRAGPRSAHRALSRS